MNRKLYKFFTDDHRRIEELLDKATEIKGEINLEYYHKFRTGLLKHIKMEENILFPAAQRANGGNPIPLAAKLRLDHGALTSLMAPPPTDDIVKVIRHILYYHDIAEEEPGGMYEVCEKLTESQTQEILNQLAQTPEVPVLKHNALPFVFEAAKRSLLRAGYDFDAIAQSKENY